MFHQMILRNIADDSEAYTYVKSILDQKDGRKNIIALKERYCNNATQQEKINEANKVLKNITYCNERAMTFEKFSSKLQMAVDTLTDCKSPPPNGDVADMIWEKILNPKLNSYINALKAQYSLNPCSCKLILQDIASQIPIIGHRRILE